MKLGEVKANVFEIRRDEKRKNTVIANISTYEGKGQNDKSLYCSWRARFVSDAYEKALALKDKDRIIITKGKVENNYNKEKERVYVTVTIFDFDIDDDGR